MDYGRRSFLSKMYLRLYLAFWAGKVFESCMGGDGVRWVSSSTYRDTGCHYTGGAGAHLAFLKFSMKPVNKLGS